GQIQPSPASHVGAGVLQRKCACGGSAGSCEACKADREGIPQRTATQAGAIDAVPPIVHEVLRSPGSPLNPDTRAFFEPRFGFDFSAVRVHTDERADRSARAVNALAYTVGEDVGFRGDAYAPHSAKGRRLLAHELSHVVQQ